MHFFKKFSILNVDLKGVHMINLSLSEENAKVLYDLLNSELQNLRDAYKNDKNNKEIVSRYDNLNSISCDLCLKLAELHDYDE